MDQRKSQYQTVVYHDENANTKFKKQSYDRQCTWHTLEPAIFKTLGYLSIAVVPLIFAGWLPRSKSYFQHLNIFQSAPLGGSLELNQAKAIDFVSSAVFAPLMLAVFNHVWFANARVSVANERQTSNKGTSLYALVAASRISGGSYNLVNIWELCASRSICLMIFAMLTLAAALGKSSLSNIIAYEAFQQPIAAAPVQLRLLTGPYLSSFGVEQNTDNVTWSASHDQRKDFVQGTTEVLQGIAWQNSTQMLTSGAFLALNVTSYELTQLDSSLITLYNVPAINGTIECQAHNLTDFQLELWSQTNNNGFTLQFDVPQQNLIANATNPKVGWSADVPAPLTVFQDGTGSHTRSLDFLAYSNGADETSMYVGSIGVVTGSEQNAWTTENTIPLSSPFGSIQAQSFKVSNAGVCPKHSECTLLIWGIICTVHQRQGLVNLTRSLTDSKWNMNETLWSADTAVHSSKLQPLARDLGTQSFKSGKAGLGPALTPAAETCTPDSMQNINNKTCSLPGPHHLNYQTLADNLLWAEMAVQTVAYETGAMNATMSTPDMFINSSSVASVQRYRVTYIPALLFGGLLCVFVAAVLSASLLTYTTHTVSGQQFRYVDSLRLLVDCAASLPHDEKFSNAPFWSNRELEDWARTFLVRYDAYVERDGDLTAPCVLLKPIPQLSSEHLLSSSTIRRDDSVSNYSSFDFRQ